MFESGYLRGTGDRVHFVIDPEGLAELTGCLLPPSEHEPGHCGPPFTYALTWQADGDALTFAEVDPDAGNWTYVLEPWVRIG